jgi:purine-binding chemotaxis protein CheW
MSSSLIQLETNEALNVDELESRHESVGDQYLSFELGKELYCVDILKVSEIRGWQEPTLLPNAPEYIKGVINIRGDIVPVFDLRLKFGLGQIEYTKQTVIIVLKTYTMKAEKSIGVVVDRVSDVFYFDPEAIREAPESTASLDAFAVKGLCNHGNQVVVLLDVDKVLDLTEIDRYYKSLV